MEKVTTVSRPLKTLFVLPSLSAGGAERVMITLMNGLDREQFAPMLASVINKGTLEPLIAQDIPRHILNAKGVFHSLPALYRLIRNEQPDIAISTMAHMNFALLLLRILFPQTKFIVREAITPSFILDTHQNLAPLIRLAYKYLYGQADLVISPSAIILDEFTRLGMNDTRFRLIYNPVALQKIRNAPTLTKKDIGISDGTTLFVASGRLHHQKGFDRLISVMRDYEGDWRLLILGEGEQRTELQKLITDCNLTDKITLTGHKDIPWSYYRVADAFLLPSRWEGLPNVALESLAAGTRVIAMKDAGGIAEIGASAAPRDIIVTNSMMDFMAAMRSITPKKGESPSLLPQKFEEPNIVAQFSTLLKSA